MFVYDSEVPKSLACNNLLSIDVRFYLQRHELLVLYCLDVLMASGR
jgi:hypothetical protein